MEYRGLDPLNDPYERFKHFGVPPNKQGDYAYLLHIVRSEGEQPELTVLHRVKWIGIGRRSAGPRQLTR